MKNNLIFFHVYGSMNIFNQRIMNFISERTPREHPVQFISRYRSYYYFQSNLDAGTEVFLLLAYEATDA